ncbi:type II toxin-antitoxin system RelB family antitoxin [Orrella dioscoreae]|uniref:type II toxin-antitoxin system RelB family antitoxin n=1 Tax=Orrella dioscoreae TaxID=1851544 RepID=UPI0008306E99|nr:hypothetical protein [Orrella dioscoreae]
MSVALSPIVSEFETEEQAASHDLWFRAKVQASRDDPRPSIPHDEAMARIREKLAAKLADQEAAPAMRRSRDR